MDMSRRSFIVSSTAAAAAGAALAQAQAEAQPAPAQPMPAPMPRGFNPSDPALKYELVIAGGEVLDPSLRLRGKRDIGIKNGQIAAVAASIPADRAVQRIDATGKLVTPGLIDLHTHLCPHLGLGLPADEMVGITCTTTAVSAGDAGANTWGAFHHLALPHSRTRLFAFVHISSIGLGLPADEMVGITCTTTAVSAGDAGANTWGAFHHLALPHSRTRLFAFVHISSIGLAGGLAPGEMLNIDYADVDRCAKVVSENPDTALGVKVRITDNVVGQNGLEPLRRAIRAAELAGRNARVMCHIGAAPGNLSDLLDLLRPGDVLTHSYSGAGNNTVQNGQLLPAALAAKKRGVIIDVGHGGGSFDFTVAEPAMQQGMPPDTISSDIHSVSINTPGYPTLPWVMSKFLALGMR